MAARPCGTPPELAHKRVNEAGSMTLSIGSIFGGQNQPSRNAPPSMIPEGRERIDWKCQAAVKLDYSRPV